MSRPDAALRATRVRHIYLIWFFQSYQDEIKLHGKWIKSLLRKCEDKCEWDAIKDLEERWHKIRLRILEWQYFLEGLTWTDSYKVCAEE